MDKKKSKKVRVKFVEELKTDYKVIPMELRISRAKKKQELRKMSEEYIDR